MVILYYFSKFGWTVPFNYKNALTIKDSLENILITSKRSPQLIEAERRKKFLNIFLLISSKNIIKRYSRYTSLGAVFAERFNCTFTGLPKKLIYETGDADWVDVLPTITKQYIIRLHSSAKLSPIQASSRKKKGFVNQVFLDKEKKIEPKFIIHDLVRTADLKKTFSKYDTSSWSYNLYKITEVVKGTIPSYKITGIPERYN